MKVLRVEKLTLNGEPFEIVHVELDAEEGKTLCASLPEPIVSDEMRAALLHAAQHDNVKARGARASR